ncbi:MAG: hypothetical protein P4L50_20770 [Anaerolineaceae bacterium]|nr:hypothetical protein [Anaerolineaceae bacterium]
MTTPQDELTPLETTPTPVTAPSIGIAAQGLSTSEDTESLPEFTPLDLDSAQETMMTISPDRTIILQQEISSDDRLWVCLGYIFAPIIPIVILFMKDKQERPFIKAHNTQAMLLGIVEWTINFILSFIVIGVVTAVITILLNIYLGIKASRGGLIKIPIITDFVKNHGWN